MADTAVTVNFGDGSPATQTGLNTPVEHTFTSGGFTVTAVADDGRRGNTRVAGPGAYTITVAGRGEPAQPNPTLSIPNLTLRKGETTQQVTRLTNDAGQAEHCTGRITIAGIVKAGLKAGELTMTIPDWYAPNPGGMDVEFTADGDDYVGSYGQPDGFPIYAGMQGQTTNEWTLAAAAGAPADTFDATTETLAQDGTVLAVASWKLGVAPARDENGGEDGGDGDQPEPDDTGGGS